MESMDVSRNNTARIELQEPTLLVIARWALASVGITANLIVIFVFIYSKIYKKSVSLKLLLQQTVIDLIGSLLFLTCIVDVPDGRAGNIFCKIRFLFKYMSVTSTYNFVVLTIERYIAVVHPLLYRQKAFGGKMTCLSLISPHVCGLLLSGFAVINADVEPDLKDCKMAGINSLAALVIVIPHSVIPICTMIYCYVQMLLKLRKTQRVNHKPPSENQPRVNREAERVRSDLLTTLFLIAFVYIFTMAPCCVFVIYFIISNGFIHIFYEASLLLQELNLAINPFIYCMAYKDFQRGIRKIRQYVFQD